VNQGFGYSVALTTDAMAVGAWQESSSARGTNGDQMDNTTGGAGAIYVLVRASATWMQRDYVKASNTDRDDRFGASLALSGGILAVGALGEASTVVGLNPINGDADNTGPDAGAIYIFR
jgi:trimeric autotransporter adhesin